MPVCTEDYLSASISANRRLTVCVYRRGFDEYKISPVKKNKQICFNQLFTNMQKAYAKWKHNLNNPFILVLKVLLVSCKRIGVTSRAHFYFCLLLWNTLSIFDTFQHYSTNKPGYFNYRLGSDIANTARDPKLLFINPFAPRDIWASSKWDQVILSSRQ